VDGRQQLDLVWVFSQCVSAVRRSPAAGRMGSLAGWRLTMTESKYWFCHTCRPGSLSRDAAYMRPTLSLGQPEKSIYLIGASICRVLHSAGVRAIASLGRIEHLQARCLHTKQVACSRKQRSSDVATTEYGALVGSATTIRYWTEAGDSKKLIKSPSLANDVGFGPNSRPSASQAHEPASDSYQCRARRQGAFRLHFPRSPRLVLMTTRFVDASRTGLGSHASSKPIQP
jgi:hypothetical protein